MARRRRTRALPDDVPIPWLRPGDFSFPFVAFEGNLPYFLITNQDTIAHVFTLIVAAAQGAPVVTNVITVPAGTMAQIPVASWSSIQIDTPTSLVTHVYSPEPVIFQAGGNLDPFGNQKQATHQSAPQGIGAGVLSVPAGTAFTTLSTSGSPVSAGNRVWYSLAVSGPIATAGSVAYIAVYGSVSGRFYAVAIAGGGATVGYLDFPYTGEALSIVYLNNDTVAHVMIAWAWVTSP